MSSRAFLGRAAQWGKAGFPSGWGVQAPVPYCPDAPPPPGAHARRLLRKPQPRVAPLIRLTPLLAIIGAAALAQDPGSLLRRSAEVYRGLRSFEASGVLVTRIQRAGIGYDVRLAVSMVQADSTQLPADSPVPALSPLLSFGELEFRDAAGTPAPADLAKLSSPRGWLLFGQMDQRVQQVCRLPDETIDYGGQAVACWVLEVTYEPGFPSRALSGSPVRYWIDPSNLLVVGVSFTVRDSARGDAIAWKFTAHEVKTNEAPPRWALQVLPELAGHEREDWHARQAPPFALRDLEGREVSLAALRGHAVLLSFWASWCVPCKEEIPLLEKLKAEWEPRGLRVWGVTNESAEKASAWLTRHGFDLPTLVDADRRVYSDYEAARIPVSVVLDRDGNVVSYLAGLGGEAHFRAAIKKALAK